VSTENEVKEKVAHFEDIDLKTSFKTEGINILKGGVMTIQPIPVENVCGTPTYTIQVSNDKGTDDRTTDREDDGRYVNLSPLSTNVSFEDAIQINYNPFPWRRMRICTNSKQGDSGKVNFIIMIAGWEK
jgi:hypothetical protein